MLSREQRKIKRLSKMILWLTKKGVDQLDIEVDTGLHLLVTISPINAVTAVPRKKNE